MTVRVWASSRASRGKVRLPSVLSEVDGVAGHGVEAFRQSLAESLAKGLGQPHAYVFYSARTFSRTTATACPEPIQIPMTP
jgi:hypothetical protein